MDMTEKVNYDLNTGDDPVNPDHYKLGKWQAMDLIDIILKYAGYKVHQAHYVYNILKYVIRAPRKNGRVDLLKAQWNLTRLLEKFEDDHE